MSGGCRATDIRALHGTAADRLREVFTTPGPLLAGADAAGDRLVTLPALFHLLWLQELAAVDLSVDLLGPRTVVRGAGGGAR
ncbi:hypothetical protein [Streptomyces lunaelactis]|uniref:hypothetical protein n=1 Tax=Streptomyces lunaelactis TaxID=1535768 RepID=UPI002814DEB4|nr:hypothetical protein [Streptomyces lunaelactis]